MRTYTIDDNGFEHNNYFAVENWWTGDLHSFLTQQPSTNYIQALEDVELLQISHQNMELFYEKVHKFERFSRLLFQRSLIAYAERRKQFISLKAEERYLDFIEKNPHLQQRIPQKHLATYLGITPEFLSMLRKKRSRK